MGNLTLKNAGIWLVKTITKTSLKSVIDKSPTTMILVHKTGNLKYEYADITNP
ncbi:MAG: hypothetical protein WA393_08000 [Nitrososphaeraceae archaeon]